MLRGGHDFVCSLLHMPETQETIVNDQTTRRILHILAAIWLLLAVWLILELAR